MAGRYIGSWDGVESATLQSNTVSVILVIPGEVR